MQRKTLFHIVLEGWLLLISLAVLALLLGFWLGVWVILPGGLAALACVLFFRDAPRYITAEPLAVVAPVDGRIIHRRECHDPYLDREAIKVTIQISALGAYYIRSPVEGTVLELDRELVEDSKGVASLIRTDKGDYLIMAIKHGSLLGQRPCLKGYGERVGQGRCCGQRRLARRMELFLPINARMEVALGSHVQAGTSTLAKLVHKKNHPPKEL